MSVSTLEYERLTMSETYIVDRFLFPFTRGRAYRQRVGVGRVDEPARRGGTKRSRKKRGILREREFHGATIMQSTSGGRRRTGFEVRIFSLEAPCTRSVGPYVDGRKYASLFSNQQQSLLRYPPPCEPRTEHRATRRVTMAPSSQMCTLIFLGNAVLNRRCVKIK